MSRAGAERALDLLNLVLRERHSDHCGGTCRVDLDGFPHDCCYACNLAQEIGELYERRAKDFMWADDEVQQDREAYAKAWGSPKASATPEMQTFLMSLAGYGVAAHTMPGDTPAKDAELLRAFMQGAARSSCEERGSK